MCQSKANGGLRCSSHTVDAMYAHAEKQIEAVKAYAQANGLALPDESKLYKKSDDSSYVYDKTEEKPAYRQALARLDIARKARQEAEYQLVSVAGFKHETSLASFLWTRNVEAKKAIQTRDKAFESDDDEQASEAITKLKQLRQETVTHANDIVARVHSVSQRNLLYSLAGDDSHPAYLKELKRKEKEADENFDAVRRGLVETETNRLISKRLRSHPDYQKIATAENFAGTPEQATWGKKQKTLEKDYSMTREYRLKLEAIASTHPEGSPERAAAEKQVEKVKLLRERTIVKNIASFKAGQGEVKDAKKPKFQATKGGDFWRQQVLSGD